MSETDPNSSARPLRHGETWTWTDFELLLQGLVNGLSLQQIAAELQRTPSAVEAQLPRLVPEDPKTQRGTKALIGWLRRRLTESPGYDWRAVLNSHSDDPYRVWSPAEDDVLREGWTRRAGLPDLAAELQASEPAIVRRLIELGCADDVGEVFDRLGATSGGSVEARARLLRAELAEGVYVLVVARAGRPIVSLHHSQKEAEEAYRRISDASEAADSRPWVMLRSLDGRDAGQHWKARTVT